VDFHQHRHVPVARKFTQQLTAMATTFESREELYQSEDPTTPTDQPIEVVQPMAPARVTHGGSSLAEVSPGSWCSSGSEHSPSSASSFRPTKKSKRVLMWGTAGGCDGYGDV
jgi:hypothetical protein